MTKAVDAYVKLCEQDARLPNVFDFLSETKDLESREKLELVLVDQYHRWKRNQAIPVEHYLDRLSEFRGALTVPLLVEEYGHLEERGVAPTAVDFARKYRGLGAEVYALLCEELEVDPKGVQSESGRTIGRYQVVCSIGRGAFGEVFLGRDPTLDRSVAIKVPNRKRIEKGGGPEELLNEARAIAHLDHPNIVPVYDYGTTDSGDCYIVSRYIKGKDLRSEIRKPISHLEAARITATLARALHTAHQAGVVHRDVKPANIILDARRQPHLLDFGLAFREHQPDQAGGLVGTPAYMSPEQACGEARLVDGRSDIYSLAVVFYEMLARRRPFQGREIEEQLQLLKTAEVQPPRQFVESIPRPLEKTCLKALSRVTSQRFNTAGDFAEELETWIAEVTVSVDETSRSSRQTEGTHGLSSSALRWKNYGRLPTGPSVAVLPFANLGDLADIGFAGSLTEEIITQLARFKDMFVLGGHTTAGFASQQAEISDLKETGRKLGVDYLLTGSLRRLSDQLRVSARLLDATTARHVWTESFRGDLSTQDVFDIEDQIARQVSASLGLHDGVIARARLSESQPSADMDAYDSVTRFYAYWRSADPKALYVQVRKDLEATVQREPRYYAAWAALAFLYLDAFVWDFSVPETPQQILALAGKAARCAADGSPQDARALHALFRYEFHSGRIESFMDVVERALTANPNETNMLADAAACLACLGHWERALLLIRKAIALNPHPPDWYHVTECWHALATGKFELALTCANRMGSVGVYWGPALRACALAHLGRVEESLQQLKILTELQPDFAVRFAREMQIWNVNADLQNATIAGFSIAGLIPEPPTE